MGKFYYFLNVAKVAKCGKNGKNIIKNLIKIKKLNSF